MHAPAFAREAAHRSALVAAPSAEDEQAFVDDLTGWEAVKRGEIWTAVGDVYATKPRPVLSIQDGHFATTDSVTVIPMTTTALDAPMLRIPVDPTSTNGLEHPARS